jgi:hypothetical protein
MGLTPHAARFVQPTQTSEMLSQKAFRFSSLSARTSATLPSMGHVPAMIGKVSEQ